MQKKYIDYATDLLNNNNVIEIIKDLKKIFAENGLYHEEGACLEKLFHITKSPELFLEIGDIFLNKVRNRDIANAAYNKYLYHTNKDFYLKYANNLKALGFNCADTENNDENLPDELVQKCDKFDLIVYIMIFLHKNNDIESVLALIPVLGKLKEAVTDYNFIGDKSYLKDIENSEKHLSKILSKTKHHNDLNKFAVQLDRENKNAYINIIDDLITYKNYNEAYSYYNDIYCSVSNGVKKQSIVDICWVLSDFYRDNYEFYDAVRLQKMALELDLNKSGEECNA